MKEAHALASHGVLVSAAHVEDSISHFRKVGRARHEAVITIDDDESLAVGHSGNHRVHLPAGAASREEDLGHEHEIVPAPCSCFGEARRKCVRRISRYVGAGHDAVFLEARQLPA